MAIKISPSNIFDIKHTAIPLNSYDNVSLDERNYSVVDDIVSESKTFTFYEKQVEVSENGTTTTRIVSVIDKNDESFSDDPWIEIANTGRGVTAFVPLNIVQISKIDTEDVNADLIRVTSHKIRRETRYFDGIVSNGIIVTGDEYTTVTFVEPFEARRSTSNSRTIDVRYSAHIMQTTAAYPTKVKYILSETFSIAGKCVKETDLTIASYDADAISKNILRLPTNELIQGGNYYIGSNNNYSDKFIAEVYDRYKNGKETATLLCLVGKYYDLGGNLVVDADNADATIAPLLKKYDLVVPYIYTSNGEVPLSTDKYGNAKQFQIIGVNFRYRGIARQEIVIQEYAP